MTLFLTGTVGDQPQLWPLDQDTLRIGRSSRNPIQISDPTVSKEHAEITRAAASACSSATWAVATARA